MQKKYRLRGLSVAYIKKKYYLCAVFRWKKCNNTQIIRWKKCCDTQIIRWKKCNNIYNIR
jgi:hypothetical protein